MIPKIIRKALLLPIGLLRKVLNSIRASPALPDLLPVGGLSGERASQLLFALRQVVSDEQVLEQCLACPLLWTRNVNCVDGGPFTRST
jgi:hypothetical protein